MLEVVKQVLQVFGLGILPLVIAYVGTMWLYYGLRKRNADGRFVIEFSIVGIALGLSVLVKMAVLLWPCDGQGDFVSVFLLALYSGIGGIAFEGLPISSVVELRDIPSYFIWLYVGSSLYAGMIAVTVITLSASYEFYSGMLLRFVRWGRHRKDFYVFTSVTEDALLLAKSIQQEHEKNRTKYCILFAGEDLEAFNRKNLLHREIMSHGFLYQTYSRNVSAHHQSLVRRFGLHLDNMKSGAPEKRFRIFSFNFNNTTHRELETENCSFAFEEIKAMAREMYEDVPPDQDSFLPAYPMVVDFYVLSTSDLNYQFYEREVSRLIRQVLCEVFSTERVQAEEARFYAIEDNKKKKRWQEIEKFFQVHVLNEAHLSARCLGCRLENVLDVDTINPATHRRIVKEGAREFHALVLGFGKVGQSAMKRLYVDTTAHEVTEVENGKRRVIPTQFVADVYDQNLDAIGGLFAKTHPMFVCLGDENATDGWTPDSVQAQSLQVVREIFTQVLSDSDRVKEWHGATDESVDAQMALPIVAFHRASCFGLPFMDFLDAKTGTEEPLIKNKYDYDVLIVALGHDEDNLAMANALIDDIKHEFSACAENKPTSANRQLLVVNIRDGRNVGRLNWTDQEDSKKYPYLKVIPFGRREDMYSYKQIIEDQRDIEYHVGYELISSSKTFEEFQKLFDAGITPTDGYDGLLQTCGEAILQRPATTPVSWLLTSDFKKESNQSAHSYVHHLHRFLRDQGSTPLQFRDIEFFARLEHERWNRFHISNGWTYASYDTNQEKKMRHLNREHNCLCPFDNLMQDVKIYDVVNVAIAQATLGHDQNGTESK